MTYVPKVGDRVRATSGENVLVGEVNTAPTGGYIELHSDDFGYIELGYDEWAFEQIVEPMSFKPFAVVRVAPDVVRRSIDDAFSNDSLEFVHTAEGLWERFGSLSSGLGDADLERVIRDGRAVLVFEGVDPA